MEKPLQVFCCYARRDQKLLLELKETYLKPLEYASLIKVWADVDINAGLEWEREIEEHLDTAHIILLLISPDFMASGYCYSKEMTRAMERHEKREARVVPIILRPADWQSAPFAKLQVLPTNAEPVFHEKRYRKEKAFLDVAKGIRRAAEELLRQSATTISIVQPADTSEEIIGDSPTAKESNYQTSDENSPLAVLVEESSNQPPVEILTSQNASPELLKVGQSPRLLAEELKSSLRTEGTSVQPIVVTPKKTVDNGGSTYDAPAAQRPSPRETLSPVAQPVVVDLQFSFLPDRLTQLGFQALVLNDGTRLVTPPMCDVLPGPFEMGTLRSIDPQAYSDELPAHTVSLNGFRIARFPVTVAEYDCAVRMKRVREPERWVEQLAVPYQPAVYVSWDDAVQYTNWLAEKTSEAWRLPTEAEWEKAAKWDDLTQTCRRYPWGEEWNSDNANTKEHNRRWVSTIGSFPQGASPCGALDMCGNVSEWTHSIYKSYPYNALDGRENERSADRRVIRGGSWFDPQRDARTTFRVGKSPIERLNTLGFRLALSGLGEVEE